MNLQNGVLYVCQLCKRASSGIPMGCIKCAAILCPECAVGGGCSRTGEHAPAGWALRTATGVWSCSSSTWQGRRAHERATAVTLYQVQLSAVPHLARLELHVATPSRELLPVDLNVGQLVELLLNGGTVLDGAVAGWKPHEGGLLLAVRARAVGFGVGLEGGGWYRPEPAAAPDQDGSPA